MPIYEYQCAACGHHTDALQKMSDAPLRKCPECGKQRLRRLVSAPQFRLKGGGWYETDFKGGSETKRNLVEKGGDDAGASAAKSETTSDTATKEAAPAAETPKPASPKPEAAKRAAAKKKAPPKARAAKSSRK
jgi:putative FmdB family regulatory protein